MDGSTGIVETSSGSAGTNIIIFPFREARGHILETRRHCETLRQSIETLRDSLTTIEKIIENVDDLRVRERLQCQIARLNELLLLRLGQVAGIDRLLQETVRSSSPRDR
ncbi:hypothetical protein LRP30_30845 [Bradyrhizobium sp. C-145]|uniref:hypothetical protein n=1 Tax=Bradyrhizobium sp. C-145 TaxID=574727 RepID=UPI00201B78BC|nr:hypothetical protein [Bradyrhizobium sp. C-145]UQR61319.1 hypothetical protein LRP30_30845 [Bradyrhizobium sp. C-145]